MRFGQRHWLALHALMLKGGGWAHPLTRESWGAEEPQEFVTLTTCCVLGMVDRFSFGLACRRRLVTRRLRRGPRARGQCPISANLRSGVSIGHRHFRCSAVQAIVPNGMVASSVRGVAEREKQFAGSTDGAHTETGGGRHS